YSKPTLLQIEVSNHEHQTVQRELRIRISAVTRPHSPVRKTHDEFTLAIELAAGETKRVDVPILIRQSNEPVIEAELIDTTGRRVGQETRAVGGGFGRVVALICKDDNVCHDVQNQIQFAGTEEQQRTREQNLHYVTLKEPPSSWWAYSNAAEV